MPIDSRLENYLATLDRALAAIPVSDRAEIVTEIKSHVLSARERDPDQALDSVLAALGDPEVVANRYLLERGLKPSRPPVSSAVKWIVIAFLGTFGILVVAVIALAFYLSPVIKIDGEKDRVTLLGGMITIDGDHVSIGDEKMDQRVEGQADGPMAKGQKVSLDVSNSKLVLSTATDGILRWSCRSTASNLPSSVAVVAGTEVKLDFGSPIFLKCEIEVPEGVVFSLAGANGKVELDEPRFSLNADMGNGKFLVKRSEGVKYAYDLKVKNGKVNAPASDANPEHTIALRLGNGKISVE